MKTWDNVFECKQKIKNALILHYGVLKVIKVIIVCSRGSDE